MTYDTPTEKEREWLEEIAARVYERRYEESIERANAEEE